MVGVVSQISSLVLSNGSSLVPGGDISFKISPISISAVFSMRFNCPLDTEIYSSRKVNIERQSVYKGIFRSPVSGIQLSKRLSTEELRSFDYTVFCMAKYIILGG